MPVGAASIFPAFLMVALEIILFVLCIRIGRRKGIHLALCILAGLFHTLGLIVILLIPAKGAGKKNSGFAPPSASTYGRQDQGFRTEAIHSVNKTESFKPRENPLDPNSPKH